MTLNLFLDANILLSFYALSNADITQLSQLKGVVGSGDIKLFINDQVRNEFERNREKKIQESFEILRKNTFKVLAPSFVRSIRQFAELQDVLTKANKKHAELVKISSNLIESRCLDADGIVSGLFSTAGVMETTSQQLSDAVMRFRVGNPPGKNKVTLGDQLNWEFLLSVVPDGEDLHLISIDGDYASPIEPQKASKFLDKEWATKKGSNLYFYKDLSQFFKLHVPKIKLANQIKLNKLISELSASESFAATHATVARFPENAEFNDAQISELISIKNNNSQVGWIADDTDLSNFYTPILKRFCELNPTLRDSNNNDDDIDPAEYFIDDP